MLESELKKSMDTLAREYMMVGDAGTDAFNNIGESMQNVSGGMTREQRAEAFQRDQDELKYMRSLGIIDLAEYRKNMNQLNVKYNSDSSEEYKKHYAEINGITFAGESALTKVLKSGVGARTSAAKSALAAQTAEVKKAYNQQVQIVKNAYEQQKKAAKDAYDAQIAEIDRELEAKEAAINAEIKAIDKAIEARRRQKQEDSYDQQISALQASIDYGGGKFDEFTLRELQAQLSGLEEERADYRWELEQEDRKAELQEELENARTLAEQQKVALQEMYDQQMAAMEEEYQMHLEQLDAIFKTADGEFKQISSEFVSAMQAGAESAAATLRAAISAAQSAAQDLYRSQQSSSYTDSRTYSPNVTFNASGMSARQIGDIVDRLTYE
ncbi:MAG: hypothetical protein ACOX83_10860 [Candidatus Spyradocola sp.]